MTTQSLPAETLAVVNSPPAGHTGDFSPGVLRFMKIAVVVMGVILIVGFATLVGLIAYRSSKLATSGSGATTLPALAIPLALPNGATVAAVALDGNRLAVHYRSAGGETIAIVDLISGQVVTRVTTVPEN